MTPRTDTPKDRHPNRQAAMLARLREKGLGLAPHVEGGRIVRSKARNKRPAGKSASMATTAPQAPSGVVGHPDEIRPAERLTAGSTFELVIPAPCEFLNANRDKSLHWGDKGRMVKQWRSAGRVAAKRAGLPRGLARVQIDAHVIKPIANRFDPANWAPTAKAVVDGLVTDYGLCEDDNRHHVAGPFMHDGGKGSDSLRIVVTVLG